MRRLAAAILLCLPLAATAQTEQEERDRGLLTRLIEDNLSGVSRQVIVEGFQGALSSRATIEELTIADQDGIWFRAEGLAFEWDRGAVLGGRIDVQEMSAESLTLLRAPISEPQPPDPEAAPFALPDLPVAVLINEIRAETITLGAPLLGEEIVLTLDGAVSLDGGEGTARIVADRLNGVGRFEIAGGYSNTTQVLDLALDLFEDDGGLVVRLLDLSGQPSVDLSIDGTGPIDDFSADLTLATAGTQRLTGQFGLEQQTDDAGRNRLDLAFDLGGDVGAMLPADYAPFFGDDVSLSLRVERQDDGAVRLRDLDIDAEALRLQGRADLSAEGWPLTLDLDMQVAARDGAPVLLPLTGPRTLVQSSTLSLQYDVAAGDRWEGQFDIQGLDRPGLFAPVLQLDGGGSIVPGTADAPGSFSAALTYAASALQIEDTALARAIGTDISGALDLARSSGGPFEIAGFGLNGAGLALNGSGTVQGPDSGFAASITADLTADSLARFADIAGLEGLSGGAGLGLRLTAQPLSGGFDLALSGRTEDLALGISALDPLLSGAGTLALTADRDETGTRLSNLSIQTAETSLSAEASLTSSGSSGTFDLVIADAGVALPGLDGPATLTGAAEQSASGLLTLDAEASLPGTRATVFASLPQAEGAAVVQTDLQLQTADLAPYSAVAGRDLAGSLTLGINGLIQTDLALFDVAVDAQARDFSGGIPALDPLMSGLAALDGRVLRTGPGNLSVDGIALRTPALETEVTGSFTDGAGSADFGLQLFDITVIEPRLTGQAMVAGQVVREADGTLSLDGLATGPGGAVASVDAALPAGAGAGAAVSGTLIATLADLAPYSALAGRALSGATDARLTGQAATDLSTFSLDFDMAGRDLVAGGIGLTGGLTATGAADRTPDGTARLTLEATGPGGTSANLMAEATPEGETFDITTDLGISSETIQPYSGLVGRPLSGGMTLGVTGTARADTSRFDLALEGETRNLDVGIAPLATLLRGTGTVRTRASRGSSGGITLQGVRIAYPNLTAAGSLDGRGGSGTGAFNARLADIGLFTSDLSGPVTAQGTASLGADGRWSTQTAATGPGGIRADISGSVAGANSLNLQVNGVAPLGLANAYIEPRRLQGTARFDLSVTGPAALSSLSGAVTVSDARLAAPTLGRALENLRGTIDLTAGRAQLDIAAEAETGGSLRLTGPVALTGNQEANLVLIGENLAERDPTLYDTTVNARLTVIGPLAGGALIGGTVQLGDTEVQVPSSDLSSLGNLPDVRHLGAGTGVRQTLARAGLTTQGTEAGTNGNGGGGIAYPLDITVEAPARIFVRGRGVDAELGGSLRLTGTTAQVIPSGRFSLIRGRIDILQQRFALDEGSITLEGEFTPFIRLVATTAARDGTAISIIIEGPASAPVVTFASVPELPQDEILARLIFDQPLNEITPLQAVQLAAAVSELAGRGGAGLINNFRDDLGLDDLDIATDDDGAVAVRAGKYLTENVYTDVTVGSDRTEIQLNLDLTDDLTVTGRANSDGETGLGIFFERDY